MFNQLFKKFIIVMIIFITLFIFNCSKPHQGTDAHAQIVTSIFPIYDMTQNIAGERMKVVYLVPPGANPHTYEPTPSKVVHLGEARVFIGVSPHFDGWIEKFLSPDAKRLYLLQEEHVKNPHVWLSFKKALVLSSDIAKTLIQLDPDGEKVYRDNLMAYTKKIDHADKKVRAMLSGYKGRAFIQWHPAWDFFAADYGLSVLATIESGHGDEPSIKEFKEIILRAKKHRVSLIVTGIRNQSTAVEALRKEIDGTVVQLDSIGGPDREGRNSYIDMMLYNAEQLSLSLGKTQSGR